MDEPRRWDPSEWSQSFGLLDMGGNVWEWSQGGEKMQFLRGGSWVNGPTLTQCNKRTNTKDSHSYIKGNT